LRNCQVVRMVGDDGGVELGEDLLSTLDVRG
jgi:hypothetical protein